MLGYFKKISVYSLSIFLFIVVIFLSSFSRLQELKEKNRRIDQMIEKLKEENAILEQQIQYLKNEPFYQEKILREKMGVVRKGEIPVRIIEE